MSRGIREGSYGHSTDSTAFYGQNDDAKDEIKARRKYRFFSLPPKIQSRRAEIKVSKEELSRLMRLHKDRPEFALFLVGVQSECLSEETLQSSLKEKATRHVYGRMSKTIGKPRDPRKLEYAVGKKELPDEVRVACQKGDKGDEGLSPNQDNFSITYFSNGYRLACVFDGHGQEGHQVATRTVQTVPYFFINSESFPHSIEDALIEAFEKAHKDVVALAVRDQWDVIVSGTTAAAALWKDDKLWSAHCGDSRCVVGTMTNGHIIFETADHKPDDDGEKARIHASGGRIKSETFDDGWTSHRVFLGYEDFPGLAMTRSLGDVCVKECGVVATPQVSQVTLDLKKRPFIVLSSDGVWEFMNTQDVVKIVREAGSIGRALSNVQSQSLELWFQEEEDYCDDVTTVLVQLDSPAASEKSS
jgi:serine/threonine protein phosphatase PrpC